MAQAHRLGDGGQSSGLQWLGPAVALRGQGSDAISSPGPAFCLWESRQPSQDGAEIFAFPLCLCWPCCFYEFGVNRSKIMRRRRLTALLSPPSRPRRRGDADRTTYDVKLGFIPGTKPDVDTGADVEQAKRACEARQCLAFTFRDAPDVAGGVHVYLKADTTVAENDKSWSSFIKRPAGLMDVNFFNRLDFPLELCWIDMVGSAAPICYGTVQPGGSKNMSSFAGHNFVLKRMVWSHAGPSTSRTVSLEDDDGLTTRGGSTGAGDQPASGRTSGIGRRVGAPCWRLRRRRRPQRWRAGGAEQRPVAAGGGAPRRGGRRACCRADAGGPRDVPRVVPAGGILRVASLAGAPSYSRASSSVSPPSKSASPTTLSSNKSFPSKRCAASSRPWAAGRRSWRPKPPPPRPPPPRRRGRRPPRRCRRHRHRPLAVAAAYGMHGQSDRGGGMRLTRREPRRRSRRPRRWRWTRIAASMAMRPLETAAADPPSAATVPARLLSLSCTPAAATL